MLQHALDRMIGKTVERVEEGDMHFRIYFTDGTHVEVLCRTTEEGWLEIDGDF